MFSPNHPCFSLSKEGEKEFGHIFPGGVPIKRGHLIKTVKLERSGKAIDRICCVDWDALDEDQRSKCLVYMSERFGVDPKTIRADIESRGWLPLQTRYIIEAYDLRFFV